LSLRGMQARTTRHATAAMLLVQPDSGRYVGEPHDGDGGQRKVSWNCLYATRVGDQT